MGLSVICMYKFIRPFLSFWTSSQSHCQDLDLDAVIFQDLSNFVHFGHFFGSLDQLLNYPADLTFNSTSFISLMLYLSYWVMQTCSCLAIIHSILPLTFMSKFSRLAVPPLFWFTDQLPTPSWFLGNDLRTLKWYVMSFPKWLYPVESRTSKVLT